MNFMENSSEMQMPLQCIQTNRDRDRDRNRTKWLQYPKASVTGCSMNISTQILNKEFLSVLVLLV